MVDSTDVGLCTLDKGIRHCISGWIETGAFWVLGHVGAAVSVEDSQSRTSGAKKPYTGKDHIPTHDGNVMRQYQRRVRLFESTTSIDVTFRAGKLLERLSGAMWEAWETLDPSTLELFQTFKRTKVNNSIPDSTDQRVWHGS